MSTAGERRRRIIGTTMGLAAFGGAIGILLAGCSAGTSSNNAAAAVTKTGASNSAASSTAGRSAGARVGQANFQAYTACLQQHGVKVPTFSARAFPSGSRRPHPSGTVVRPSGSFSRRPGGFGGAGGSGGGFAGFLGSATADPATQAALKACASLLPQGGFGHGGQVGAGAISATTYAAFRSCMSDNGVVIAASDAQTGLRGLNRADPKTAAALKICQPIIGAATKAGGIGGAAPSQAPSPSAG